MWSFAGRLGRVYAEPGYVEAALSQGCRVKEDSIHAGFRAHRAAGREGRMRSAFELASRSSRLALTSSLVVLAFLASAPAAVAQLPSDPTGATDTVTETRGAAGETATGRTGPAVETVTQTAEPAVDTTTETTT